MEDNIILFPFTIEQHLERGFMGIEKRNFEEALEHFAAVSHYDPSHREAKLAKALCLFELHRYEEVINITSSLLYEGDDSYFEILRLHIEALIHNGNSEEAQVFLEALMEEETLPPMFIEQQELLKSISKEPEYKQPSLQYKIEDDPTYKKKLLEWLKNGTSEQKQNAIEQSFFLYDEDLENALKDYLLADNDPVSKTFALQALKTMGESDSVKLLKNNKQYEVELASVPVQAEEWQEICAPVYRALVDRTESESPSLMKFAVQLWMEYLFIIYPEVPEDKKANLLTAAIHAITAEMLALSTVESVANDYNIKEKALLSCISDIRQTLQLRAHSI